MTADLAYFGIAGLLTAMAFAAVSAMASAHSSAELTHMGLVAFYAGLGMVGIAFLNIGLGILLKGGFMGGIHLLYVLVSCPGFVLAYALSPAGYLGLPGGAWLELPLFILLCYRLTFFEFTFLGRAVKLK